MSKKIPADTRDEQPLSKPDPETLDTTDPQEHMEGPLSSLMQNIKDKADKEGAEKPAPPVDDTPGDD